MLELVALVYATYSHSSLCPDWCDCVATKESDDDQDLKLSCDWPYIPDKERLQFLVPAGQSKIVRLQIRCKSTTGTGDVKPKNQLSAGLFEHMNHLKHLHVSQCQLDGNYLAENFTIGLERLKSMELNQVANFAVQQSFTIQSGAFARLAQLEKLSILDSKLDTFLSSSDLCNLVELTYLNLSGNGIKSLDDLKCTKNHKSQLVMLDVSRNKLVELTPDALSTFKSLRLLQLERNLLKIVPKNLFVDNRELMTVDLSRNKLTQVESLPKSLHTLDLSYNNLDTVPTTVGNHQQVQTLKMSNNQIDSVNEVGFSSNPQLSFLDLSHNNLNAVSSTFFGFQPNQLTHLDLSSNDIQSIVLKNMTKLTSLDLSSNKLSAITPANFQGLSELKQLFLDQNLISNIAPHALLPMHDKLSTLSMSKNLLVNVPPEIGQLRQLQLLNLSYNSLSSIAGFPFANLANLKHIDVAGNKLSMLDRFTFDRMDKIVSLNLSHNQLQNLEPGSFDGVPNLQELSLDDNLLLDITGVLANLNQLKLLNISQNRLTHIDLALLPTNLHEFSATNNQINQITAFLSNIINRKTNNLKRIDFSQNRLEKLTSEMIPQSVEVAKFSGNLIRDVDQEVFAEKANLMELHLSSNQLKSLKQPARPVLAQNLHLFLENNPLKCDCHLDWIKSPKMSTRLSSISDSIESQNVGEVQIVDFDALKCTTNKHDILSSQQQQPQYVSTVSRHEFLCPYSLTCQKDCLCCDFDSCDCKSVCPHNCTCLVDKLSTINEVRCSGAWKNPTIIAKYGGQDKLIRSVPKFATEIWLDGLNLPMLNKTIFLGRPRLKRLHLNQSRISQIAPRTFASLTMLDTLDLSSNQIHTLNGNEFQSTTKLETLFLHDNRLSKLAVGVFDNLPNLKLVTLHGNRFQILPIWLSVGGALATTTTIPTPDNGVLTYTEAQRGPRLPDLTLGEWEIVL